MGDWQKKYQDFVKSGGQISVSPNPGIANNQNSRQTIPGEINIDSILQNRIAQKAMIHGNNAFGAPNTASRAVRIKPGVSIYKGLQTGGFGTSGAFTLVVYSGDSTQMTGRDFVVCGEKKCFLAEQSTMHTIDLGMIASQPNLLKPFVEVQAPFFGSVFVRACDLEGYSSMPQNIYGSKTILKG